MVRNIIHALILLLPVYVMAQEPMAHQRFADNYSHYGELSEIQWDSLHGQPSWQPPVSLKTTACTLNKEVYGWHPYWMGTSYSSYHFDLLSTVAYFSYEVDAATGNYTSIHNWKTTNLVSLAHAQGCRVELAVTLFSGFSTFFASATSQARLIDSLVALVQLKGADGVNIDFENLPSSQKTNFTNFMITLSNRMHTDVPGSRVTMAMYAVDWNNVFDMPVLRNYVDRFIIMGYDYYYSGSPTSGPVAPLYNGTLFGSYNLVKSINYYLGTGCPHDQLICALPYYGQDWPTSGSAVPSTTTGTGTARLYNYVQTNFVGTYTQYWENQSHTPYFVYNPGSGWRQCFADNDSSLGFKYDMIISKGIAGSGMWALGYDNGYTALWDLIQEKFTDCYAPACTGNLYDMGGPSGNYYSNERYKFTIAPAGASSVTLTFSSFNLATGDVLSIFDGADTTGVPAATYTGTTIPAAFTSSGPALTIRFVSNSSGTAAGFAATWACNQDVTPPVTTPDPGASWKSADFLCSFTDTDSESGVDERYFLPASLSGSDWLAKDSAGFLLDAFDGLRTTWNILSGTWTATGGVLNQASTSAANSNIYTYLNQHSTQAYAYGWKFRLDGTGTNRRSGLHIFADDPTLSNRGNNYLIWWRADQDKLEIYKVTTNTLNVVHSVDVPLNTGIWYQSLATYNPVSGTINVYLNQKLIGTWTDPTPLTAGNYISLRNGDSDASFDDLMVYQQRSGTSQWISVGPSGLLYEQNPAPGTSAGQVYSLITDMAGNVSNPSGVLVNVDWSPPGCMSVMDGTASDIDSLMIPATCSGNWGAALDPNSGITDYWYAVGTAPGTADLIWWTNNSLSTSFTQTGLPLVSGQSYYVSVRAINGANLSSDTCSSDGAVYYLPTGMEQMENADFRFHPNPSNGDFVVETIQSGVIEIVGANGNVMLKKYVDAPGEVMRCTGLPAGVYVIQFLPVQGGVVRALIQLL